MKTQFPAKSKEYEKIIREISDVIVELGEDKIAFVILFGSFANGTWVRDDYIKDMIIYEYASDFDILVVTKHKKHAGNSWSSDFKRKVVSELDKRYLNDVHKAHIIIESLPKLNDKIEVKHYFFHDIKKEGIILYQAKGCELSKPRKLNNAERKEIAEEDFEHWFERAKGFMISYKAVFDEKMYKDAAFQLHQAAESFLNCTILVLTGYKPKTHSIKALNKFCASRSNRFLNLFPLATAEQKKCFELLEKAYVDARYEKSYKITKEQLEYLIEIVEKLKVITEEVCKEKILSFK